jgi:hypothetical protein
MEKQWPQCRVATHLNDGDITGFNWIQKVLGEKQSKSSYKFFTDQQINKPSTNQLTVLNASASLFCHSVLCCIRGYRKRLLTHSGMFPNQDLCPLSVKLSSQAFL